MHMEQRWLIGGGLAFATGLAVTTPHGPAVIAIITLTIWTWKLRRKLGPVLLSPVQTVCMAITGLAVLGVLFYEDIADAPGGAGIRILLPANLVWPTFWLLIACAATVLATGTVATLLKAPGSPIATRVVSIPPRLRIVLLVGGAVPPLLMLVDYGMQPLVLRSTYLMASQGPLAAAGTQIAVAAVPVLGYVIAQGRGAERFAAIGIMLVYCAFFLSLGSRRLALVPILVALGYFAGAMSRRSRVGLLGGAALSLYLVQLPLYLRALPSHGLQSYLPALQDFIFVNLDPTSVARNLLIGFATIALVAFVQPPIPTADFWVSVNPLPGGLTGWYDIAAGHRLNEYTPYPAIGELGNHGWPYLIGYFIAAATVLAHLDVRVKRMLAEGHVLPGLLVIGLSGLFLLFSMQYNLRSSTRVLLYALVVDLLVWHWQRLRVGKRVWETAREEPAVERGT